MAVALFCVQKEANGMENEATQLKIEPRKMKIIIKWVVSPYRKDKRTGVIDAPVTLDRYHKMLWDEIDNQFK